MNLLIPRRRSRPQLNCPDYYKYRALVHIIHNSTVAERAKSAQAVAVLVRKFLRELGKWCASFWVGSSVQLSLYLLLGALASLGYWIATRILFSVKVKVLGGWLRPVVG